MGREERIRAHLKARAAGAPDRVAKHDGHFAAEYITTPKGQAVSTSLAKLLGVTAADITRKPREDDAA